MDVGAQAGMLVRMAVRNTARKPMRSAVTVSAMALSAAVMIFFGAIMVGYIERMKTSALAMETAEVQVHTPKYRDEPGLHELMDDSATIAGALRKQGLRATERLYAFALAAHKQVSSGVVIRGVDLTHEPRVTLLHTAIDQGQWLSEDAPRGVVVGRKLARRLGLKLGDEFVVLSQAADGSMADDLFTVRGILKTVSAGIDGGGIVIPIATFRELMAVHEGAHEIAAIRGEAVTDGGLDALQASVKAVAGDNEVLTWPVLQPALAEVLRTSDAAIGFMLMIAYLAVVTVVLNATLMSVFERMREFGVLKALGVAPRQIFVLVMAEATVMAVGASVVAVLLGVLISWAFRDGIDLSSQVGDLSMSGMTVPPIIPVSLTPGSIVGPVAVLVVMVVLSALYPAYKAAVVRPVYAIRGR